MQAKPSPAGAPVALEQVESDGARVQFARQGARTVADPREPRFKFDMGDPAANGVAQSARQQKGTLAGIVHPHGDNAGGR